ncbi:MAG: FAD-linked oxidase C-terminal domain-containing protein, partial [Acidimicrobiales bacterium]
SAPPDRAHLSVRGDARPGPLALLRAAKQHLDPEGLINPGVLGLP